MPIIECKECAAWYEGDEKETRLCPACLRMAAALKRFEKEEDDE